MMNRDILKKRRTNHKVVKNRSKHLLSQQKYQTIKIKSKKRKLDNNPTLSAKQVCYILLFVFVALVMIFQKSINIYWQQFYHIDIKLNTVLKLISKQFISEPSINEPSINEQSISESHNIDNELVHTDKDQIQNENSVSLEQNSHTKKNAVNLPTEGEHVAGQGKQSNKNLLNSDNPKTLTQLFELYQNKPNDESKNGNELNSSALGILPKPIVLTKKDKVLFAGDSLMQGVAPFVKKILFKQYKIESINESKQSTGLSYPKAFDWPKTVNDKLTEDPTIRLLVVFLGPNDPWDIPDKIVSNKYVKFKSSLWEEVYRSRIKAILDSAHEHNVQVLWLAPPCMRKTKLNDGIIYLNGLYQSEVIKADQHFLITNDLLGCSYDNFNSYITTENRKVKVRIDDGIHFTVDGQKILAKAIMDQITINEIEDNNSD
ncbi:DUF459 domain-containing protein [Orbaceae bacterium ESL0721]|nr:DUF459 domain-containing protein [Orbaceae bacterium ESL0721]